MEASKFDSADMEGQFAKPDIFAKDGVTARMDNKFPFHPLERSEAKYELIDNSETRDVIQRRKHFLYGPICRYHKNIEQSELHMLRRTMGMAMPLKLAMEKKVSLLSFEIKILTMVVCRL